MTTQRTAPAVDSDRLPPKHQNPMHAARTLAAAHEAGLKLVLNEDKEAIMAGPPHKITEHLRSSIRHNKDELMRDLLFAEAVAYLQNRIECQNIPPGNPAVKQAHGALAADPEAFNRAWADAGFGAFKAALRERLKEALHELAAHTSSGSPPDDRPEPSAEPEAQQTLPEAS